MPIKRSLLVLPRVVPVGRRILREQTQTARNLTRQRETTGDSCKNGVASNDDSLTEIGKYFAILIFADSYWPRNTAKIGRPRKFPRIRYQWVLNISFIPSSEFNAYLKQIKVLLSTVKKYRIFSLVKNTIYIFSLQQTEAISTIQGFISSRKERECTVHVWHYATGVLASNKATDVTLWRNLSSHTANLHMTSVQRQSFKWFS